MSIYDMTEDEFRSFESAIDKDDWQCDHGRMFTEDCDACDTEWMVKEDAETVMEGELVDEPAPTECDHHEPLVPGFGKCAKCDQQAQNTAVMSPAMVYRLVKGKRWKFKDNEWEPVYIYSETTYPVTTTPYKKKECKHFMQYFAIDGELGIYASAERDAPYNDKRSKDDYPDVGVYLYSGWVRDYEEKFVSSKGLDVPWKNSPKYTPPWPMAYLEWPDYGVPKSMTDTIKALEWIWAAIKDGKHVETGCMGGHGRTGTLLAGLLVMQGVKPGSACQQVWDGYCEEAIESKSQVELIVKLYEHWHGKKWRKSKTERDIINELLEPPKKKATVVSVVKDDKPKPAMVDPSKHKDARCIHGRKMDEPCTGCDYDGWH